MRERGRPKTKEFIYQPVNMSTGSTDLLNSKIVYDLKTACEERILKISQPQYHAPEPTEEIKRAVESATRLMKQAPNLTLNVTKAITSPGATWAFAAMGIVIQLGVIVIASLVTYNWHLAENGFSRVRYGFPLFVIGRQPSTIAPACSVYYLLTISQVQSFSRRVSSCALVRYILLLPDDI